MGELYIGTSGYSYSEWRGVFYPEDLPAEEYLAFYAEHFNAVELNFSYYSIPKEKQLAAMAAQSAGKVKFSIKGNRQFTHEIVQSEWREAVKKFRSALSPLLNSGLLLSVLLQFPQSFHYVPANRKYLADLLDEFGDTPLVLEFRHIDWFNERVYDALRKRNAGVCMCDMPSISRLPSLMRLDSRDLVFGDSGYFRFHGRNSGQWYQSDNSRDRYDYLYTDDELKSYLPVVREMAGKAKLVQVYFNNHAKGAAAINARKMKILLGFPDQ
jgi:uncharacterized protein YecE (DUF72 family)